MVIIGDIVVGGFELGSMDGGEGAPMSGWLWCGCAYAYSPVDRFGKI